ncbi:MAG: hypothetical protein N2747_10790 [Chitinophagaceae bacterium]|nr:hypothetical protein [Chitinophagaceae bacterium]
MSQTTSSNPLAGLHKSKMYTLLLSALTLIGLILPWVTAKAFGFGYSYNGFHGWGYLALLGIAAAVYSCFAGNKTEPYDDMGKKIALGGFGGISLAALITLLRIITSGKGLISPGIGLFISLAGGVLGLLLLLGFVKPPKAIDEKVDKLS